MSTLFAEAGAWIGSVDSVDQAALITALGRDNYGWVVIKAHHSLKLENDGKLAAAVAAYRGSGLKVGLWGWLEGDPVAEATAAANLGRQYAADFYVANAEEPYEHPANMGKSKAFVDAFRAAMPTIPLGLSCLGGSLWKREFDYVPWQQAGAACLPQTYWGRAEQEAAANQAGAASYLTVANCVHCMVETEAAWPKDRVHPTLGLWGAGYLHTASEYAADLRAAGTVGFNVFLADQMVAEDWHVLGAAIPELAVARGGSAPTPPAPPPPAPRTKPARSPLVERNAAKSHLAHAVDLYRQAGKSEATIETTRVYWAGRLLTASDSDFEDAVAALTVVLPPETPPS